MHSACIRPLMKVLLCLLMALLFPSWHNTRGRVLVGLLGGIVGWWSSLSSPRRKACRLSSPLDTVAVSAQAIFLHVCARVRSCVCAHVYACVPGIGILGVGVVS